MSAAMPEIHPDRLARHEARQQLIQKQQQLQTQQEEAPQQEQKHHQEPKPHQPSPGSRRPSNRASSPSGRRPSGPGSRPGLRRPPSPSRRRSGPGRPPSKRETSIAPVVVDREKVCPLLLRVFIKENGAFRAEDFAFDLSQLTPSEMQIYTWKDATLRELVEAIRSAKPSARPNSAKFEVSFAYPVPDGIEVRRVGSLHAGRAGSDDQLTLARLRFETGDFLAVSIFT